MKIIILGPAHPFRGGIAAFNDRLAIEFKNAGHEVQIFTFSLQYPSLLFPGKSQYSEDKAPHDIVTKQTVNSISPINWLRIGQQLRKINADLIISRFWLPFMGPSLGTILKLAKSKNTKVISIVDNIIPHESRPGDKVFAQYFVNQNDALVTLSHDVAKDLSQFMFKGKIITSPHPVYDQYGESIPKEQAKTHLKLDPQKKHILFFGLIRAYKGLELLLKSIPLLDNKDIHLVIAGEFYEDKTRYDEIIKELEIEDRLTITNSFIKDEEVKHYFSACDLIVQPYLTATQSGVTQIAYHFNKPMIVTNVGGLPEMCPNEKVGFVVERSEKELAKAINQFFSLPERHFSEGIRTEKKKYEWSVFVNKLVSLYKSIA